MQTTERRPAHHTHHHGAQGKRRFLIHYVEMVVAMLAGMFVLGGLVRGVVALAGVEYGMATHPELTILEMALDMSIGMVVWMRVRGHGWAGTLEMAAVMIAPALVLVPFVRLGALGADTAMLLEHLAMFPLMFLAMLRRRGEYGGRPS
ncbi:hypothetical protein [Glycomyces tenuis]|uniref:hypothetical protein n=1 Tax=Glycomyces tenuis TaxID=58116 RepID=UPI00041445C4|nr:hypothetical protein [Glycomyces tenuis]